MSKSSKRSPSPAAPSTDHEAPERVALYARVSTDDQAERDTIDAQRTFLRRYAELHGLHVVDLYEDDGISGAMPLADRPGGKRLLVDAEAGRFSTVVFYRVTRFARSLDALL